MDAATPRKNPDPLHVIKDCLASFDLNSICMFAVSEV